MPRSIMIGDLRVQRPLHKQPRSLEMASAFLEDEDQKMGTSIYEEKGGQDLEQTISYRVCLYSFPPLKKLTDRQTCERVVFTYMLIPFFSRSHASHMRKPKDKVFSGS